MTPDPCTRQLPRVIELVGMPGSGKSTLAGELAAEFGHRGVRTILNDDGSAPPGHFQEIPRYRRRLERAGTVLAHPRLAASIAVRSTSLGAAKDLWRLVTRELRRQRLSKVLSDLVIMDEGPLHKLSMLYADDQVLRVPGLLSKLTEPSFCVSLTLDPDVAIARLRSRQSTSPVDSRPSNDLERYLARYAAFQARMTRSLRCPVVELDASSKADVAALADRFLNPAHGD